MTVMCWSRGHLLVGQDRDRLIGRTGDLEPLGRRPLQFSFSHQPPAEPAHAAQPGADGGGLGGLGQLGQPRGDGVPGQLLERRRPAAVGRPAAEVPDGLAVEPDRPRCVGSGPSRPGGRPEDYARSTAGRGLSVEWTLCFPGVERRVIRPRWWDAWPGSVGPAWVLPASSGSETRKRCSDRQNRRSRMSVSGWVIGRVPAPGTCALRHCSCPCPSRSPFTVSVLGAARCSAPGSVLRPIDRVHYRCGLGQSAAARGRRRAPEVAIAEQLIALRSVTWSSPLIDVVVGCGPYAERLREVA
jgi:hypothetical protein